MKKTLIILAVVVAIAAAAIFWWTRQNRSGSSYTEEPAAYPAPAASTSTSPAAPQAATTPSAANTTTINVTGRNFSFSPSTIRVKKGTTVKIVFTDADGFHDLTVDGYNVHTDRLESGDTATVQFVADKTGTFAYYCSVGTHRALGMQGSLIVE